MGKFPLGERAITVCPAPYVRPRPGDVVYLRADGSGLRFYDGETGEALSA
jgi:hypothetical protein